MNFHRASLFLCWVSLCVDICLSQNDCTGVDCPVLLNCIETVLETGACCPSCIQKGCTCEGYQYYDCIQKGFRHGKVPQGESYFVDFGSTKCSCPQGGGKISCRFIPCAEIPPTCIEVIQPADGCPQCGRIGCTHGNKKYEAGHSFQIDTCQVCHCPNEGGKLMCSHIPGCDLSGVNKPMWVTTENNNPLRDFSSRHDSPVEPFSKLTPGNTLPLYKQDPPSFGTEDYDYTLAEPTSSTIQDLAQSMESTPVPPAYAESSSTSFSSHYDRRHELKEPKKGPNSVKRREGENTQSIDPTYTGTQSETSTLLTTTSTQRVTTEEIGERTITQNSDKIKAMQDTIKDSAYTAHDSKVAKHFGHHKHSPETPTGSHGISHSVGHGEQEKASMEHRQLRQEEQFSTKQFRPTNSTPAKIRENGEQLQRQHQTQYNSQLEDTEVSAKEFVKTCCETGEKWASTNGHCSSMEPPTKDRHSICWTAQQQCCHGSLTESRCIAGINAARTERMCEDDAADKCGNDFYKAISDSPYAKEAFSIGEERDRENTVEGPLEVEDMDECLIYEDNICHHRCVNTPGSFHCECFPGYVLQEDAFTCAQGKVKTANLTLLHSANRKETTPVSSTAPQWVEGHNAPVFQDSRLGLMDIHVKLNERCVNTAGSYTCQRVITCPPGYQINNDICEDINECLQRSHNCGLGFECVNTEGSFRCNPKARCSVGFNLDAQGNCIDIDECGTLAPPCSPGFNCINTAGSYMCQRKIICSRGYHASPDGSRCVDVDECQSSLHRCGEGQQCTNLPGSYRCECQRGYQYDSFRRMCVDVNECLATPCSQECANIYGSYQCYCRQGYYLREDGHTCDDIDECSQSIGHLCTYRCVNVPGSYQCACPEYGYTMSPNGRSCRDIDECATGTNNCSLAETCYNIQGGYRCLSLDCPQNYRKVSDTRCERISCPNYLECQNSPQRITYYYLSFQSNIIVPAQIFRIGPSPAYSGDNVIVSITKGNEENYFSTRKLNAYTGAVYLHRQVEGPKDFLINVEMKLWRQGTFTTFHARIYVFITPSSL
ncbi:Fibulin-2 [Channa argus]|uniref:Fibulin-2 n=1 Tax=Channa argus TaxID=215402 RepID=A0A6G1Q3Y2_CHAAH|nr:Fibulin-2 [Channa argus]